MKKLLLLTPVLIFFYGNLLGQYAAVQYDLQKNYFNEGQYLPAEKPMMFSGVIPEGVNIIEINIFPDNATKEKHKLYVAIWKAFETEQGSNFSTAVNFPLRPSEEYDFRIDYFRKIRPSERTDLTNRLISLTKAYLASSLSLKGNGINIAKKKKQIIEDMNLIVTETLKDYRSQNTNSFEGFSVTIEQKLEQLEDLNLVKRQQDSTTAARQGRRENIFGQKLKEIISAAESEVEQLMDKEWSKLSTSRIVDNYQTESRKGTFKLNVGYGAVYLGGNLNNLDYGTAPYVGVSFPLGNRTLSAPFFRNSSVILGAFLQDFENVQGDEITGFLIDQPMYLGLDYKLFEFIRFNAGAAILEQQSTSINPLGERSSERDILIKPFIGLSARIDLAIGLGK